MIWLISVAFAGTLQIHPDRVSLQIGDPTPGFFTVTNTGTGRVSGSVDVTPFDDNVACTPANIEITPQSIRLLPGHEQEIQVRYSGDVGCVSAAGVTIGSTEIVIPILVGDDESIPVVLSALPLQAEGVVLQVAVLGDAPVQAHLALVQQEMELAARLPDVALVLLPYECTRVELRPLPLPLTSATVIQGVLSANGEQHHFTQRVSQPLHSEFVDHSSACPTH